MARALREANTAAVLDSMPANQIFRARARRETSIAAVLDSILDFRAQKNAANHRRPRPQRRQRVRRAGREDIRRRARVRRDGDGGAGQDGLHLRGLEGCLRRLFHCRPSRRAAVATRISEAKPFRASQALATPHDEAHAAGWRRLRARHRVKFSARMAHSRNEMFVRAA